MSIPSEDQIEKAFASVEKLLAEAKAMRKVSYEIFPPIDLRPGSINEINPKPKRYKNCWSLVRIEAIFRPTDFVLGLRWAAASRYYNCCEVLLFLIPCFPISIVFGLDREELDD